MESSLFLWRMGMREPRQEARGPDSRMNSHVTVWNPRICGLFLDDYWVTSLIRCVSFALAPALVLHLSLTNQLRIGLCVEKLAVITILRLEQRHTKSKHPLCTETALTVVIAREWLKTIHPNQPLYCITTNSHFKSFLIILSKQTSEPINQSF